MGSEPFSVLMSAYIGTRLDEIQACFESILSQCTTPAEIVIVFDGPVQADVEAYVRSLRDIGVTPVFRRTHTGLGPALGNGLAHCNFELVARMDTDDICLPGRFECQSRFMAENPHISVVGGLLREHYTRVEERQPVVVTRRMPCDPAVIRGAAKLRNPINHQTAMFRKAHVTRVGSYTDFPWFEDYFLWARMIVAGYLLANLNRVFVETQVGPEYFKHRGGIKYLGHELRLARAFKRIGFHSAQDTVKFVASRTAFRIVPTSIRAQLYRGILRGHNEPL
jgi:glycosyltransferase involved in cell wall biosynthesis